jgi:arylsulfatase A-like enzyme
LLKKSVNFDDCFVPLARTAPSLLSFFLGVLPFRHGIRDNFSHSSDLLLDVTPLPEVLKKKGYNTALISDWCGTDLTKFKLGFKWQDLPDDQWNLRYFIKQGPKDIRLFLSLFLQNRLGRLFFPEIFYLGGVPKGKYLLERSALWIKKLAKKKQPFFLTIFFSTTHPPFGSEYPYYSLYADKNYWGESKFAMSRLTNPEDIIRSQKEPKEAFDLEQIKALYDGTVTNFDDQVATLLALIKENKIDNNTIIIIYSDHGMEFFENDTWGQGNSVLSDLSYKIPLIIYHPKWTQPKNITQAVRSIDLLPTLLDMLELSTDDQYDGQSLMPMIKKDERIALDIIAETGIWFSRPPGMAKTHRHYPELFELIDIADDGTIVLKEALKDKVYQAKDTMLISGKWKLVRLPMRDQDQFYLFDRLNDPYYKQDVSKDYPDILDCLKKKLYDVLDMA